MTYRYTRVVGAAITMCVLLSGCSGPPLPDTVSGETAAAIDRGKLVDLSYVYGEDTIYWPNAEGFRHRKDVWDITDGGYWYAAGEFTSAEHGGTHFDSPIHFAEGQATVDQIPVTDLIAPLAVIDVSTQSQNNRDYRVTPEDIAAYEEQYGPIASGMIVMVRTGWGEYWPDRLRYMGDDTPGVTTNLHFPGLSAEAAELLVDRGVAGVAIDTASIDYGPSQDFIVHQILNGAGIYGIENIANAGLLPATGVTLIALPLRIAEGSGSPARVVALLP